MVDGPISRVVKSLCSNPCPEEGFIVSYTVFVDFELKIILALL